MIFFAKVGMISNTERERKRGEREIVRERDSVRERERVCEREDRTGEGWIKKDVDGIHMNNMT